MLHAQSATVFTVFDSTTAGPLSEAAIRISPLDRKSGSEPIIGLIDRKGQFSFQYDKPLVVFISYLGYTSIIDTITNAQNKSYFMRKATANMEDVVVTGQYGPSSSKASVYDVKVYTQKDFRDKGATNLREALQGSLSIDMNQDAILGSGLSLQGISGTGVKIMIDGVPVEGRLNGNIDISQINLSNIERVEIVKGPMSVIYGTDAMGGVVNLISKSSQREKLNFNLKGYYESVGQYNVELNGGLHFGRSQFFFSGGRNFFDGYSVVDTSRHKDWRAKEQYFGSAKYIFTHAKFKIGASASFFRELMLDRGNLRPYTTYAFDEHYLTMRPMANLFATVPIKDFSELNILLAYSGYVRFSNYFIKDLVTLNENIRTGESQDTAIYHNITARATYALNSRSKKLNFQFGVDINQEFAKLSNVSNDNLQIGDYAVFGSVKWMPVKGLDIQPALRFGYNTKFTSPLIPSLNIKYDFARYFSARISYGRSYRAPSLKELYLNFVNSNHIIQGRSDLKAEDGHSVNASLSYQTVIKGHALRVYNAGFFNLIFNQIDLVTVSSINTQLTLQYLNFAQKMTAGGEHSLDYRWKRLSAGVGVLYTWTQTEGKPNNFVSLISPDVTARIGYKIPKAEIELSCFYKYTGKKLFYVATYGEVEASYRSEFHTIDVTASRNFWKDRIQLTVGGKNLFNVTNVAVTGAVAAVHSDDPDHVPISWGRSFFISLNLHFAQ
jgi:outer membrane receptor for ferrienterochelin and colicins